MRVRKGASWNLCLLEVFEWRISKAESKLVPRGFWVQAALQIVWLLESFLTGDVEIQTTIKLPHVRA